MTPPLAFNLALLPLPSELLCFMVLYLSDQNEMAPKKIMREEQLVNPPIDYITYVNAL